MEQRPPVRGIWLRYGLFLVFTIAWFAAATIYFRMQQPAQKANGKDQLAQGAGEKDAKAGKDAKAAKDAASKEPAGKEAVGKGDSSKEKEKVPPAKSGEKPAPKAPDGEKPPAKPAEKAPAQAAVPETFVTLGSLDPKSPYRMLVTLTNRGAGVTRIELNSPRYHELEDKGGYMGYVIVDDRAVVKGCPVQVVGPGTPAAAAGLAQGDVILEVAGQPTSGPESLQAALSQTKPGQTVELKVRRKNAELTLPVTLARHPLQVVRPETGAPPSFLMTLTEIDDRKRDVPEGDDAAKAPSEPRPAYPPELDGVDLRTANWDVELDPKDPARVTFRRYLPQWELEVVKTFRLAEVPEDAEEDTAVKAHAYKAYHLTFDVEIHNRLDTARRVVYEIDGPSGLPDEGWWYASKVSGALRDVVAGFRLANGGRLDKITFTSTEIGKKPPGVKQRTDPLQFIGVDAQYFDAVLIPQPDSPSELWFAQWEPFYYGQLDRDLPNKVNSSFAAWSVPEELAPKGNDHDVLSRRFQVFAGPKKPALVAQYGLSDVIYYGWYGWVAEPLLAILHFFYSIIPNYGVAIILLTVLVRGCMHPLSRKQARSAQKMQELQPEIKRIAEKYKNSPEARNKAQAELFRKHNFHPMGGCLLLFLQLPIFVGLYRALMVDVELRQAPLITEGLGWATNLAAPDMLFNWSSFMPHFVTKGTGILGLGPYFNLLPVFTIVLFLWQQKKMTPAVTDEKAAMNMKVMKYMMVFMGIMFFKVASGLCLYFIASSLWSIAERQFLPKTIAHRRPAGQPDRRDPPPTGEAARARVNSAMYPLDDTIAAIASPPGGAARGILRLSGPDAEYFARQVFQPVPSPFGRGSG